MVNHLISIIIPIYNTEEYVDDIINDVLVQTYKYFQLILINDGSTDNSGQICERYAEIDKRIDIIHKKNAGVSCARNDGIRLSKGEYICFLDADDRIDNNYIEELYNACIENNCLMSVCPVFIVNELNELSSIKQIPQGTYSYIQALKELLEFRNLNTGPCAKLFHKSIFSNELEFPIMKTYEDLLLIYKAIYKAEKVHFTQKTHYNYFHRIGIGAMDSFIKCPTEDVVIAVSEILPFIKKYVTEIFDTSFYGLISQVIMYLPIFYKNDANIKEKNTENFIYNTKKILAKYRKELLQNKTIQLKEKITFVIFSYSFKVYYNLIKILEWRNLR